MNSRNKKLIRFALVCFIGFSLMLNFALLPWILKGNTGSSLITEEPEAAQQGSYRYFAEAIFGQHLGEQFGVKTIGMSGIPNQPHLTDIVVAAGIGRGSYHGLSGWPANRSTGLSHFSNGAPEQVVDMVKYIDSVEQKTYVFFAEGGGSQPTDTGRIVKITAVDRQYVPGGSGRELVPELQVQTKSMRNIALGKFDGSHDLGLVGMSMCGTVYLFPSVNSLSEYRTTELGVYDRTWEARYFNDIIAPIQNIDDHGPTWNDIVVGFDSNLTVLSANATLAPVWNVNLGSSITHVNVIDDINGDGKQDIVVATRSNVQVISGADGSEIAKFTGIGAFFRETAVFNDYNGDGVPEIITGNSAGQVLILDINPNSPTFGQVLETITIGPNRLVFTILNIGDLNDDGKDEFAIGGRNFVRVIYGNNCSTHWSTSPHFVVDGFTIFSSLDIYDLALMADLNNDGHPEIAAVGQYGLLIYSGLGNYGFVPDLNGYGAVDLNCSTPEYEFQFFADSIQYANRSVEVTLILNGVNHSMTLSENSPDWTTPTRFTYNTTLPEGVHSYQFAFLDSYGDHLLFPNDGPLQGPRVADSCDEIDGGFFDFLGEIDGYAILPLLCFTLVGVFSLMKKLTCKKPKIAVN